MSTVSTTGLYAEDLTGTNPANLITNELQTLQVPGADDYYFIIPKAAPFFVDSLIVKNAQTGAVYVENDDYMYGHRFIEAMDSIGRPIAGSIRIMRRDIVGQVKLTYRTIGGQWGFNDAAILAELSNKQLNPLIRSWAQIHTLPALFPVLEHNQSVDDLIGSKEINDALIRLGDIIEAGASGTSASHIADYNNPHRTTKIHVQLGNVPNYLMATDTEARAGIRADLFLSPRGAQLLVQDKALAPMNAHINATGNVHGMVAADINLGNVPNFKAATALQAVDVTNNNTLLTPYGAALLIEQLQNVSRIDDIENLIAQHIANLTDPHEVTPAQIGTYTKAEIDQRIGNASGGGDAATFGGKSPEEWSDAFVSVVEIDNLMTNVTLAINASCDLIDAVVVTDTLDPTLVALKEAQKIIGAQVGFDTYFVNNNNWDAIPVQPRIAPFPTLLANAQGKWANVDGAYYYLTARGSVVSSGPNAIMAPVGYKEDVAFVPTNACNAIWATKTALYVRKLDAEGNDGAVHRFKADNSNVTVIAESKETIDLIIYNERKFTGEIGVYQYVVSEGVVAWSAYGLSAFATPITSAIATLTSGSDKIVAATVSDSHVFFVMSSGSVHTYVIARNGGGTPTGVTKVTNLQGTGAAGAVALNTVGDAITVSGTYAHIVILLADGEVVMFGDNSDGQCDVENTAGPFISATAGYNFTVTVNDRHQTQFWGDSEDNSLYYGSRGISIDPEA